MKRNQDEDYWDRPYLGTGTLYAVSDERSDQPKQVGFAKPQIEIARVYRPRGKRSKR